MKDIINIQDILNQEVSRREFLLQAGAVMLAVVGISSLMKNLLSFGQKPVNMGIDMGGYGSSGYSGVDSKISSLSR